MDGRGVGDSVEKGWLTPTRALKRQGWHLRLAFDDAVGGSEALAALQTHAAKLDEVYGKQAFRRFSSADMHVLLA